jgi:3' terminal RNA ribose 2'-O-methyltransferase Hen1
MLLTITTTRRPATDLGFLLHKNPDKVHTIDMSFGKVHVFYPEATEERCTAAVMLDVDPVGLVRGKSKGDRGSRDGGTLEQYVNDRAYVLSSFMSVALGRAFGTAMTGRSKGRQDVADEKIPLTAKLAVVACGGGDGLIRELFEPLGYAVRTERLALDEKFPEWGAGSYYAVKLEADARLQDLLRHLYVLIPVLDAEKHYWVGKAEVEKLLRKGEGWLAGHPAREAIVKRYLPRQRELAREALARLAEEDAPDPDAAAEENAELEVKMEEPIRLWQQRMHAVLAAVRAAGAKRVLDLGCGEGKLLKELLAEKGLTEIVGMDVSHRSLELASQRLKVERLAPRMKEKLKLVHGSLMYRDTRFEGYDAATVVEVIEHLDAPRLAAFERVLFEAARPRTVVITTPNAEYNLKFATLPPGQFRHKDHRFEWTRAQFEAWARRNAERFGYSVKFLPVGEEDEQVGAPTQMGVFAR